MKFKKIDLPEDEADDDDMIDENDRMSSRFQKRERSFDDFERYSKPGPNRGYGFSKYSQNPRSERQFNSWKSSRVENNDADDEFDFDESRPREVGYKRFSDRKGQDSSSFYKKKSPYKLSDEI